MLREGSGGRRPWKVWDASRTRKRLILASCLEELRERGREKLGCSPGDGVRLVLESDGTHIDDGEYLKWLPDNTVFLLLRAGEPWTVAHKHHPSSHPTPAPSSHSAHQPHPAASFSSMSTAIPRVVCEALNLLEIRTEPPFWKLIDNRGRITLVLHWELPPNNRVRYVEPNHNQSQSQPSTGAAGCGSSSSVPPELRIKTVPLHANEEVVTVVSEDGTTVTTLKSGRMETLINHIQQPSSSSSSIRKSESSASTPAVGGSTSTSRHQHQHQHQHNADECEFHCGSLHEEGRSIQGAESRSRSRTTSVSSGGKSNVHVRFHDSLEGASSAPTTTMTMTSGSSSSSTGTKRESKSLHSKSVRNAPNEKKVEKVEKQEKQEKEEKEEKQEESSESELEPESSNTIEDDLEAGVTTEKLLMLTDQLTADQRKHLTILDLGVILERLRAKIIDVERLEREREGPGCFRWMIKATIRGDILRDLGVLYNGNYYSISEHPGLAYAATGFEDDDEEDREDPV